MGGDKVVGGKRMFGISKAREIDSESTEKKRDSREGEWSEEAERISVVTHRQAGSQRQRGIYCRAQGEGRRRRGRQGTGWPVNRS